VARDRKRAKQRRDRARATTVGQGAPSSGQTRADVPGALDHASADVDEFDAALVKGAGGVPAGNELAEEAFGGGGGKDDDRVEEAGSSGNGSGAGGGALSGPVEPSGAPQRGRKSAIGFLRACWAELQRVQWPDRRQVTQATAVVIGFVAIAGAYLGLADYVAKELVEFIL
jgi:preprotein translocase subunit SecE